MRWTLVLLLLTLALPALASDGVLEINQTCAEQTGCFAGDTAGFPITITTSGSYRLTSNLTVPNENTDGILVMANNVGIDLNDFSILGPVTCSGSPLTCTPASGTGNGVERFLPTHRGTSVKNGSIAGMGQYGVYLEDQAQVVNLRVSWNRVSGIRTNNSATISGNTIYQNGSMGIDAGSGVTVAGNTAFDHGTNGIRAFTGSTVSGNTAYANGANGIIAGAGSTVSGNTSYGNLGDGINLSTGSNVSGNTCFDNVGDGIQVSSGSHVQGNSVRGNDAYGLNLVSNATYRENTITTFATPTPLGTVNSGVNLGNNSCDGTTTCP